MLYESKRAVGNYLGKQTIIDDKNVKKSRISQHFRFEDDKTNLNIFRLMKLIS